ncbi:hypothetical protein Tco_1259807, partial [Tanacetum coccineum]
MPKERKTVIVDYSEPSHPAKKLRENRGTPGGTFVAGKSMPAIQRLLVGAVQNAEVRGKPIPSLPFMTSYVSATPERENEDHTDSKAGTNLQTFSPPPRFVISSDSSHRSSANVAEAEVDYVVKYSSPVDAATATKEAPTKPSMFGTGSSSVGGTDPTSGGFSDVSG